MGRERRRGRVGWRRWALAAAVGALAAAAPSARRLLAGAAPEPVNKIYFSKATGTAADGRGVIDIADACAGWIDAARATLDVCGHEIDNRRVVDAVLRAHRRGVAVRVLTETDYIHELGPAEFAAAGVEVRSDNRAGLMHQKFLVIDNRAVWTGSFNFTENCAVRNDNNAVVVRSDELAANYKAWFDWFWENGTAGRRPRPGATPFPLVRLPHGSRLESRFTSFDRLDRTVLALVQQAKKSIHFMAFSFTQQDLADAMLERAAQGVEVKGVFEGRNIANSVYRKLAGRPNVTVVQDGNPFAMHHKVIVLDGTTVVTGSYNFSVAAGKENDENLLVIQNRNAAFQFEQEFRRVFALGAPPALADAAAEPRRRARR